MKLDLRGGTAYPRARELVQQFDIDATHFTGAGWSRGLNKQTHSSIAEAGRKTSVKMTGKPGHPHTKESRRKMSNSASIRSSNNGPVRTKWHEVFCPYLNKPVKVQGTWERDYALWLNSKDISWVKDHTITFPWKKNENDIVRTYHPDFLLVDSGVHIEIKGFMWKDEQRGVDDERKLRLVQEQNPSLKLSILMKAELVSMGVFS